MQAAGVRDLTRVRLALGVVGVLVGVSAYYAHSFGSLDGFVRAMDHCKLLFCDFERHFHPVGAAIFSEKRPVVYFVYPPFAAFLFAIFGLFDYPVARVLWGLCQVGLAALLFGLARPSVRRDGTPLTLLYLLVFLTGIPLLHNTKWGQVSVAVTVAVLGSFALHDRGRRSAAALLLAAAVAVKLYPAIFLLYFALRRDWRFLAVCAGWLFVFLALLPVLVLGVDGALAFHRQTNAWIGELLPGFLSRWNTQYLPAALSRVLWRKFQPESTAGRVFMALGYALALLNLAGLARLHRRALEPIAPRSAALLFLTLPLVLPVTWPHYLVYLPFCQLWLVRLARALPGWRRPAALAAAGVSAALASVFAYDAAGHWILYARRGMLAWADLVLLAGFWLEAAPALWARGRPATAS